MPKLVIDCGIGIMESYKDLRNLNPKHELLKLAEIKADSFYAGEEFEKKYQPVGKYGNDLEDAIKKEKEKKKIIVYEREFNIRVEITSDNPDWNRAWCELRGKIPYERRPEEAVKLLEKWGYEVEIEHERIYANN